jgi:DEAD/DEAH box helicase domain-containing protein
MCKLISNSSEVKREIVDEVIERNDGSEVRQLFDEALKLYDEGNYSSSKDILNNILAIDKNHVDSLALMAQILYNQDQRDVSLYFVKKALSQDRSNEMANDLEVRFSNKSHESKKEVNLQSLDDVEVLYEEAYDLYEQGDLSTSAELLEQLFDFDDRNADALALMGLIYYQSGIFPKAVEYYKRASKINKNGEMVRELRMRVS